MTTMRNELTQAMENKECRAIVKISPKWKNVPKAYYAWFKGLERNLIMEYFCKEFINTIADCIPAVVIEKGELTQSQLELVKEYATEELDVLVVDEEAVQGIKIIEPMKESGEEFYVEDQREYLRQIKWKYLTKKFLRSKI